MSKKKETNGKKSSTKETEENVSKELLKSYSEMSQDQKDETIVGLIQNTLRELKDSGDLLRQIEANQKQLLANQQGIVNFMDARGIRPSKQKGKVIGHNGGKIIK